MQAPLDPHLVWLLAAVILAYGLGTLSEILNLRRLSPRLPEDLAGLCAPETYQRTVDYARATTRLDLVFAALRTLAVLLMVLSGGFAWLDRQVVAMGFGPVATGLLFLAALALASQVLSLPFEIYGTFGIEERFGFNRTTPATFVADKFKGLFLLLVLAGPLTAALLRLLQSGRLWLWIPAWGLVAVFILVLRLIGPSLILPLFNRFTPLPEGALRTALEGYARNQGFDLSGIHVMDGSRRSSKSNAFFTGFGRKKRIALYDTLIDRHAPDEVVAILAHEVGHSKLGHIPLQTLAGLAQAGLLVWLLFLAATHPPLAAALGQGRAAVHLGLVYFALSLGPLSLVLGALTNALSRVFEYQSDAFACRTTGSPEGLIQGLVRLAADNLSNLTPHPFWVMLHASHPPVLARIRALRTIDRH